MPRAPLTDEQKQVLRDRLARAREAKKLKASEPRPPAPHPAPRATRSAHVPAPATLAPHEQWTETKWMTAPLDTCKARLALLKVDFETGSRIVGQRPDVNEPSKFKCFVCDQPVPEGRWKFRHDYLNKLTGLYESIVIGGCSTRGLPCTAIFQNDTRLKQRFKDIVTGQIPADSPHQEVVIPG